MQWAVLATLEAVVTVVMEGTMGAVGEETTTRKAKAVCTTAPAGAMAAWEAMKVAMMGAMVAVGTKPPKKKFMKESSNSLMNP